MLCMTPCSAWSLAGFPQVHIHLRAQTCVEAHGTHHLAQREQDQAQGQCQIHCQELQQVFLHGSLTQKTQKMLGSDAERCQ